MTDIVYTHNFDTEYTSSVIDDIYYSEPEKLLFVALNNGTLAGYEGVPLEVFSALNALNTNRLNGDTSASVGRYWNTFVKPNFTGYSTSDIDLWSAEEYEQYQVDERELREIAKPQEASSFFNDPQVYTVTDLGNVTVPDAAILPVDGPELKSRFGITFESGDQEVSLNVQAVSANDAVERFQQAVEILGWDESPVLSVTQFFN